MPQIITIAGPTASGKTALSIQLAKEMDGEIVSCDSMQVYKDMDIGTAKPTLEEQAGIPHHMLSVAEPWEDFSVSRYCAMADPIVEDILRRGKSPIIVGGTGLYIEAVLKGYRLLPVPEDKELRRSLEGKTLAELTDMLARLKAENGSVMHNKTDVDTAKRAIRAIAVASTVSLRNSNSVPITKSFSRTLRR